MKIFGKLKLSKAKKERRLKNLLRHWKRRVAKEVKESNGKSPDWLCYKNQQPCHGKRCVKWQLADIESQNIEGDGIRTIQDKAGCTKYGRWIIL